MIATALVAVLEADSGLQTVMGGKQRFVYSLVAPPSATLPYITLGDSSNPGGTLSFGDLRELGRVVETLRISSRYNDREQVLLAYREVRRLLQGQTLAFEDGYVRGLRVALLTVFKEPAGEGSHAVVRVTGRVNG
jgi:hypothetical protein